MTPAKQKIQAEREEKARRFRQELFELARDKIGRNVACDIRSIPDRQLYELRRRSKWNVHKALQYLLIYGCRYIRKNEEDAA